MECLGKPVWNRYVREELKQISIDAPDEAVRKKVLANWDKVAKPLDGMGSFETLTAQIGAVTRSEQIDIAKKAVIIMCADNGIVEEGVTQSGQEVTALVAASMAKGQSSVCRMAQRVGAEVVPVDIGINCEKEICGVLNRNIQCGTRNFCREPAMTEEETVRAIAVGMELVASCREKGIKILAAGEMGIGNTTTSAAVLSALLHIEPERVAGRGAGLDDKGFEKKVEVINLGIQKYSDGFGKDDLYLNGVYRSNEFETFENNVSGIRRKESALHTLYSLGGLDIAGLVGLFIGGAIYHIPIVLDGVITGAAAVCAELLVPGVRDFIIPSHSGREAGNEVAISFLGLKSYINGNMALGEGTGAIMLFPLLDTIFAYYKNGADFSSYKMDAYKRF